MELVGAGMGFEGGTRLVPHFEKFWLVVGSGGR